VQFMRKGVGAVQCAWRLSNIAHLRVIQWEYETASKMNLIQSVIWFYQQNSVTKEIFSLLLYEF